MLVVQCWEAVSQAKLPYIIINMIWVQLWALARAPDLHEKIHQIVTSNNNEQHYVKVWRRTHLTDELSANKTVLAQEEKKSTDWNKLCNCRKKFGVPFKSASLRALCNEPMQNRKGKYTHILGWLKEHSRHHKIWTLEDENLRYSSSVGT